MRAMWCLAVSAVLTGCSAPQEAKNPPAKPEPVNVTAPDLFTLSLNTSKGTVAVEIHREWAPHGVDHLYSLVRTGYYDGCRIYRVTQRYAQFGVNGDPSTSRAWSMMHIPADPVKQKNRKGILTYAQTNAGTRTTQ